MPKAIPSIDLQLRNDPIALKAWIKAEAQDLGFADCVVARPDAQDQLQYLQGYLDKGYHADMHYLADNLDKRANPKLLVDGTECILCVRLNYLQEKPQGSSYPDGPCGCSARRRFQ